MKEKTPHQLVVEHILATSNNRKLKLSIISNPEGVIAWVKFNLNDWVNLIRVSSGVAIVFRQDLNVDIELILDELKKSLEHYDI